MAVSPIHTLTVNAVIGDRRMVTDKITFNAGSLYVTGGFIVAPSVFGMSFVDTVLGPGVNTVAQIQTGALRKAIYDIALQTVIIINPGTEAEAANGQNVSTHIYWLTFIGRA